MREAPRGPCEFAAGTAFTGGVLASGRISIYEYGETREKVSPVGEYGAMSGVEESGENLRQGFHFLIAK
jgi:hypothetical protein